MELSTALLARTTPCSTCQSPTKVALLVRMEPGSPWWAIYCKECSSVIEDRLLASGDANTAPQSNGKLTKGNLTVLIGGKA